MGNAFKKAFEKAASDKAMRKLQRQEYHERLRKQSIFDYAKENPRKNGYIDANVGVTLGVLGTMGASLADSFKEMLNDPEIWTPDILGPHLPLGPVPGDPGYCIEYPEHCKEKTPVCNN
jgi:hypothetical protein